MQGTVSRPTRVSTSAHRHRPFPRLLALFFGPCVSCPSRSRVRPPLSRLHASPLRERASARAHPSIPCPIGAEPQEVPPVSCVALSMTGTHTVICVQTLSVAAAHAAARKPSRPHTSPRPREPVSREPQAGPSSCGGVTSSLRSSRRSRWTTMSMRWCFHDGGGSSRPAPPASSYSRRSCRPPLDATSHSLHPLPGVSQRAACASYRWRRGRRCDATEAEPIEGTKPASCEACTQAIASCSAAAATRASCCDVSNAFTNRSSKRGSAAVEARRMIPARRPCMSWHADT